MEPSICQRALFDRCTKSFTEAKRIRLNICQNLKNEGQYIESRQYGNTEASQRATQEANSGLNQEAYVINESMATLMKIERGKIAVFVKDNQSVLSHNACRKSGALPAYRSVADRLNSDLGSMQVLLDKFHERKKSEAKVAIKNSVDSARHAQNLTSLTPMVEPAKKSNNAVPALAMGGIAGAGLLMAAKDKGYEAPIGGISPAPATGRGSPGINMDVFKGDSDKFLDENGIWIDPSFKDQEKAQIAQALNYIPACHRPKLKGMKIQNNPNLRWKKAEYRGRCLPGINSGYKIVQLNPTCYQGGISTALVVHEMIHVVASPNGMYQQYAETYHRFPGCPVTEYAQMNFNLHEDFTEAARLAVYPGSGGQLNNQCSASKVSAAKRIFASCR